MCRNTQAILFASSLPVVCCNVFSERKLRAMNVHYNTGDKTYSPCTTRSSLYTQCTHSLCCYVDLVFAGYSFDDASYTKKYTVLDSALVSYSNRLLNIFLPEAIRIALIEKLLHSSLARETSSSNI